MTNKIEIWNDAEAATPREGYRNSTMHCAHNRYRLGDVQTQPDEIAEYLQGDAIYLPLYLYDHSGITMATKPFACRWDSGQVGYIIADIAEFKSNYGWKLITKARREKILASLEAQVKEYDTWLTGEVYGYSVTNEEGDVIESCGGFYSEADAREEGARYL